MPDTTLVSIVTPSFNQAAFLEDAMRSVLLQDQGKEYGFQIEYLVVDGGSTDSSPEIIRRYRDRLAWWVSEPDSGQAEAINKGLSRSRGEFLAWLNSDDLYLPGCVAAAVAALQAHPDVGLVFADALTIDTHGRPLKKLIFGDWGLLDLVKFRIICQPAVFMRRSILEKAGFLDLSLHYMLDHQLWLRLARLAPVKHISSIWGAARHHPGAKNIAQSAGFGQETLHLLEWMKIQPDLAPIVAQHRRQVEGGAYRLNARYLLDGGLYASALKSYAKALRYDPIYALKHWHRMAYALLNMVGIGRLVNGYYRQRYRRPLGLSGIPNLQGWPGLNLLG